MGYKNTTNLLLKEKDGERREKRSAHSERELLAHVIDKQLLIQCVILVSRAAP